ncbi:MAG: nuclear transport factor 2 family protein [Frankiales bacterium]|nr:nuclear transport factor 2 family protein [Frankiales bacterium]
MTEAHEAIRNLLGTYCEVMDAGDFTALGELFADAKLIDHKGRLIAAGAGAVTELWNAMVRLYDGSPLTRHLVSGPIIEVDGDTATCRSSYLVMQLPPEGGLIPVAGGRYRDTFACTDARWHFTVRQMFLDQAGDLHQHMVDL